MSFGYHDSAAALINNGTIVAAVQEERISRKKNDRSYPVNAIKFCLDEGGISAKELDAVVYYEQPLLKFDRILRSSIFRFPIAWSYLIETIRSWFADSKFNPLQLISEKLGVDITRVSAVLHHQSHAASSFFCSPFDESLIVTLDGVGEHEVGSISFGRENVINKLLSIKFPHSLGLVYSAFTAYLGFEVNEGEYKVMGMAGFGKPRFSEEILKLFYLSEDGGFRVNQKYFDFGTAVDVAYKQSLVDWLGPPREPEARFDVFSKEATIREHSVYYADIAASLQKATEEVVLHVVSKGLKRTGQNNLCLAGGVALNSVANAKIKKEFGCNLFIQPSAGDAGGALGAALHYYHKQSGAKRHQALISPYLGPDVKSDDILRALDTSAIDDYEEFTTNDALIDYVSKRLSEGAVIGWMQGRCEWGPRALGNRSILANPSFPDMQEKVNVKIKFREPFRPFAPSILAEYASEYFDVCDDGNSSSPENFMISVSKVHDSKRLTIPAVIHVDGSARVHLVRREVNLLYYQLIKNFYERTGVPLLLNTSFNGRGEPIVNSPTDALNNFLWNELDCLVMGKFLIEKERI
ncbi:MAG: carbamoyltransferase N-terminal domain-containing protein [Pseudomonadota bacterium]|nr:carbamoyltransferase N-terminal domain-containing protein [Pseudomonadota bacterium]